MTRNSDKPKTYEEGREDELRAIMRMIEKMSEQERRERPTCMEQPHYPMNRIWWALDKLKHREPMP